MKTVTLPFIRQEGIRITTLAIVQFGLGDKDVELETEPVEALYNAVTAWVDETEDGRACWKESCGDLNIGDLAQYDESFAKYAEAKGHLKNFSILYFGDCSDMVPFDKVLSYTPEEE